jgi:hypothetical protein
MTAIASIDNRELRGLKMQKQKKIKSVELIMPLTRFDLKVEMVSMLFAFQKTNGDASVQITGFVV